MNIINVSEFRNNISEYLNRLVYKNEAFLLKRGKKIIAKVDAYKDKNDLSMDEKIKKFAGIWNDNDATTIRKYARKLRTEAKITPES